MAVRLLPLLLGTAAGVSARGFWSSTPAEAVNAITQAYPVGNGRLGGAFCVLSRNASAYVRTPSHAIW